MNSPIEERTLTTADLAAAADPSQRHMQQEQAQDMQRDPTNAMQREPQNEMQEERHAEVQRDQQGEMQREPNVRVIERTDARTVSSGARTASNDERLAALFTPDAASQFRVRWVEVQSSFVDDPAQAVRQGDELVAQVMKTLAQSFAGERSRIEGQLGQEGSASTEDLRLALRRYRSFFERLLSL